MEIQDFQIDDARHKQNDQIKIGERYIAPVQYQNGKPLFNAYELYEAVIAEMNKHPDALTPLARAAVDARQVLEQSINGLASLEEDFKSRSKIALEELRQTRFAIVSEVASMASPLKDIRQFFVGPTHELEITRLKEFVDLCERLHRLKESGFLDNIADTILRLSDKP